MTDVAHIRVECPESTRGVIAASRSARFFLTLPGAEEVEVSSWMTGADMSVGINDVRRVTLQTVCSYEVGFVPDRTR